MPKKAKATSNETTLVESSELAKTKFSTPAQTRSLYQISAERSHAKGLKTNQVKW